MNGQDIAAIVGIITLVTIAVWRFSRVETILKMVVRNQEHQHECQNVMSKELVRLNVNIKTIKSVLMGHIKRERKE